MLKPGHWRCKACTRPNAGDYTKCQHCDSPRRTFRAYRGSIDEARIMLELGASMKQVQYALGIPHTTVWRLKHGKK